jgi:hypothetical protein
MQEAPGSLADASEMGLSLIVEEKKSFLESFLLKDQNSGAVRLYRVWAG